MFDKIYKKYENKLTYIKNLKSLATVVKFIFKNLKLIKNIIILKHIINYLKIYNKLFKNI
jgi:hypothetical protein